MEWNRSTLLKLFYQAVHNSVILTKELHSFVSRTNQRLFSFSKYHPDPFDEEDRFFIADVKYFKEVHTNQYACKHTGKGIFSPGLF